MKQKKNQIQYAVDFFFFFLSFPAGWLIYKIGLTANQISLISIALTIISFFALIFFSPNYFILIPFLLLLVALLDCVDGNVARARGTTGPGGEWMDAFSGYTVYAFIPLALGIHIFLYHPFFNFPELWIIIGSLTSISNLLLRLLYQKFINGNINNFTQKEIRGDESLFSKISSELGLVGWMMPAFLFASITNMLGAYLALYCFFYMISVAIISIILVRKIIIS